MPSVFENARELYIKYVLIAKCNILQRAHSPEKTHLMTVFPTDTHNSAESTEAMCLQCLLARGHIDTAKD